MSDKMYYVKQRIPDSAREVLLDRWIIPTLLPGFLGSAKSLVIHGKLPGTILKLIFTVAD
jgi:hypothetical protein